MEGGSGFSFAGLLQRCGLAWLVILQRRGLAWLGLAWPGSSSLFSARLGLAWRAKLASKNMFSDTHHASIVFANGAGGVSVVQTHHAIMQALCLQMGGGGGLRFTAFFANSEMLLVTVLATFGHPQMLLFTVFAASHNAEMLPFTGFAGSDNTQMLFTGYAALQTQTCRLGLPRSSPQPLVCAASPNSEMLLITMFAAVENAEMLLFTVSAASANSEMLLVAVFAGSGNAEMLLFTVFAVEPRTKAEPHQGKETWPSHTFAKKNLPPVEGLGGWYTYIYICIPAGIHI